MIQNCSFCRAYDSGKISQNFGNVTIPIGTSNCLGVKATFAQLHNLSNVAISSWSGMIFNPWLYDLSGR